nr:MAG TPA: hypothetical protein [Caudoviricetes sp.]
MFPSDLFFCYFLKLDLIILRFKSYVNNFLDFFVFFSYFLFTKLKKSDIL